MTKRKIVIVLGDVSGGHISSARAMRDALLQLDSSLDVEIVDLLAEIHTFPFGNMETTWVWVSRFSIIERLSNLLLAWSNSRIGHEVFRVLVRLGGGRKAQQVLEELDPDIVISTHLLTSVLIEYTKYRGASYLTFGVICDLVDFPSLLADRHAELIFAPTAAAGVRLEKFGVKPEHIATNYFPLNPHLQSPRSRTEVMSELGFSANKPVILITGGGLGTVSLMQMFDELAARSDYQLIIIAGKNEQLKHQLAEQYGDKDHIRVYGFVNNMPDLMLASDLVIAKPGPATILELEALQKKAIFTNPIGGQENGNVDYLQQNPNFHYIGESRRGIAEIVDQTLRRQYVAFAPRFGADAAVAMMRLVIKYLR